VSEPLRWQLRLGQSTDARGVVFPLRKAVLGPSEQSWDTPSWLLPHQVEAARRIAGSIAVFGGAMLADAVGLGKTYVALAVSHRYESVVVVVPSALQSQWNRVSSSVAVPVHIVTHESLSRGTHLPRADLTVVDEAHRFRNPNTRRYERLALGLKGSNVLLLTATPVVNGPADLAHLVRLFAADNAFAILGLRSIGEAVAKREHRMLTRAIASTVVARSVESIQDLSNALPQIQDGSVSRASPIDLDKLETVLDLIDSLRFPGFSETPAHGLMKSHLLQRLASSTQAFRDTVKRHVIYTERAIAAVSNGGSLSRAEARRVFTPEDDFQCSLFEHFGEESTPVDQSQALESDQRKLFEMLRLLKTEVRNPKADALSELIKRRTSRKTIVFTTAVATALALARRLDWNELGVVGAGKSWIASGRVTADELFSLFAPIARRSREPHDSLRLNTLIATDLASEGLDLQDADAVVHYDLPWTPLRLEQRVGRIARLGSVFPVADVFWFAPPDAIEKRLRMEARISSKARDQMSLNVITTSRIGRARIVNEDLKERETAGLGAADFERSAPGYAVVEAPAVALVALRWYLGRIALPELVAVGVEQSSDTIRFADLHNLLGKLLASPPSEREPPRPLLDELLLTVRKRLSLADRGDTGPNARRLTRRTKGRAREAGRRREKKMLDSLDAVLEQIRCGLRVGGERSVETLLKQGASRRKLDEWLAELPAHDRTAPRFEIAAVLFGDGSQPAFKR